MILWQFGSGGFVEGLLIDSLIISLIYNAMTILGEVDFGTTPASD